VLADAPTGIPSDPGAAVRRHFHFSLYLDSGYLDPGRFLLFRSFLPVTLRATPLTHCLEFEFT
jgi:hypothetical protein